MKIICDFPQGFDLEKTSWPFVLKIVQSKTPFFHELFKRVSRHLICIVMFWGTTQAIFELIFKTIFSVKRFSRIPPHNYFTKKAIVVSSLPIKCVLP